MPSRVRIRGRKLLDRGIIAIQWFSSIDIARTVPYLGLKPEARGLRDLVVRKLNHINGGKFGSPKTRFSELFSQDCLMFVGIRTVIYADHRLHLVFTPFESTSL